MPVKNYQYGTTKDGYIKMILEVGFSGTVDTIWVVGYQKKMRDRSRDGKLYVDI
jgi:hypothetical protein